MTVLDDAFDEDETTTEAGPTEEEQQVAAEAQETFEDNVGKKLDEVFGDEPTPDADEEDDTTTPETEPETTPDEPADDGKDTSPAEDGTETESDDSAGDEHALTPAEIRAALHAGWTDEEITELSGANPALAKKTCAKALETMNAASKVFSEAGKKAKATPEAPAAPAPTAAPQAPAIDLTAIEAEYKDDPLYPVLKQIADTNAALTARVDSLQNTPADTSQAEAREAAAAQQQDAAVDQQLNTFFTGDTVAEYEDVFGKTTKDDENWDHITQGQMRKRLGVVDQANLILAGAKSQGVEMSLDDALHRAFLAEVATVKEGHIVAKLSKSLKKREAGITLKPGTGTKIVASNGKPSQAELEAVTGQRLAACFGT